MQRSDVVGCIRPADEVYQLILGKTALVNESSVVIHSHRVYTLRGSHVYS